MKLSQLSKSEARLAGIVGVMAAVLLNLVVFKYFSTTRAQIVQDAAQKSATLEGLRQLQKDFGFWEERAQWLQKAQPKLAGDAEGGTLLNYLKESASKNGLTLSKQQLVSSRNDAGVVAVPVQFELKGNWKSLCAFLAELQAPERFIVVQQARLRVDASDATQMQCDFTVAKWFAPR
jgi:Tfp pilus assembly protein PilO